jgi:Fe-S-cluster containining protein
MTDIFRPDNNRKCGACSACCTHLGIKELDKPQGVPCRYLTQKFGAARQCGIYAARPEACANFYCGWRLGVGNEETGRPDRSGILISVYENTRDNCGDNFDPDVPLCVTITIINENRCGNLTKGHLAEAIQKLTTSGFDDLKIVNYQKKLVIHFYKGEIKKGRLLKGNNVEDLIFEVENPPIGTYYVKEVA